MSISSPPRGSRRKRDDDWDPFEDPYKSVWQKLLERLVRSFKEPFTLGDGAGRLRALLVGSLFVFSLFAVRLIDLQAISGDSVASYAEASRTVSVIQPAQRGTIYDASGIALAQSVPAKDVTADPYLIDNPPAVAALLSPIVGLPQQNIINALQRKTLSNGQQIKFAYIARQIAMDKWDQIQKLDIKGIYSQPSTKRVYPSGSLGANVLGYTGIDPNDPNGVKQIGLAGVESLFNSELSGVDGEKTYERSATGGEIPTGTGSEVDPQPGDSYQLTINRDLQWVAQQQLNASIKRFDADSAVAVVMDPKTGRILALAQAPTDDPNSPNRKPENLRDLAVEQAFDPGSTGKVMTFAAALQEGKIDASTVFDVPNRLPRKNGTGVFQFQDDVNHPDYKMTAAGVLALSSNIGTIQVAETIGPQMLRDYFTKFGIGQKSGLGMPLENPGDLPALQDWSDLTFPNVAYGQGYSVNAIQMADVFSTIANGGLRVTPRIIDSKIDADGTVERFPDGPTEQVVSPDTAQKLIPMMEQVVLEHGTASNVAAVPGYRVAGKTGTAQLYDPTANGGKGGYRGYVASFIGFAPADDPKLVVAVITRNPKREHFGATTGGPVFKAIMTAGLEMMQVPPSGSKSPVLPLFAKGSSKGGPWNW